MASNASDKKSEARLKREQAQAAAAAAAARNKRLQILGGTLFAAIAVIIVVVAINANKKKTVDTKSDTVAGVAATKTLLTGLEQRGLALGDPKAPVTILEFIDMQCPYCKQHQLDEQPKIIKELVRTGKAKIRLEPIALSFMGEDSEAARAVLIRLANQGKGWNYANLFYWNQGPEQTGYVTQKFLDKITKAAGGTTADTASRTASGEDATKLKEIDQLSTDLGVTGTPTFAIGKTGQEPKDYKKITLTTQGSTADQIISAVNKLTASSKSGV